jgi:hypothetical protein
MFCKHCGKEINDKAVVCVGCGIPTDNKSSDGNKLVVWAYILAILMPIVGVIMGIVLLTKNKTGHGICSIIASIFAFFFWLGFMAAIAA